jgi:hypothetical protein
MEGVGRKWQVDPVEKRRLWRLDEGVGARGQLCEL